MNKNVNFFLLLILFLSAVPGLATAPFSDPHRANTDCSLGPCRVELSGVAAVQAGIHEGKLHEQIRFQPLSGGNIPILSFSMNLRGHQARLRDICLRNASVAAPADKIGIYGHVVKGVAGGKEHYQVNSVSNCYLLKN